MFRANRLRLLSLRTPDYCGSRQSLPTPPCRFRPSLHQGVAFSSGRSWLDDVKTTNSDRSNLPPANHARITSTNDEEEPKASDSPPNSVTDIVVDSVPDSAPDTATDSATKDPVPAPKNKAKAKAKAKVKAKTLRPRIKSEQNKSEQTKREQTKMSLHILQTLTKLERRYLAISKKLDAFKEEAQQKIGAPVGERPQKTDEESSRSPDEDLELTKALAKHMNRLKNNLDTVKGTLKVLKDVLDSQEIPLQSLAQPLEREGTEKSRSAASEPKEAQEPKEARKPKATGKGKARTKKASEATPKSSETSKDVKSKPENWTTLAERMSQGNKTTVAAAAAVTGASAGSAASGPENTTDEKIAEKKGTEPPKKARKAKGNTLNVESVAANDLHLNPVKMQTMPEVPRLSYGLDRALFNPGVYQLQDPHSRVYNFDPYLANIMPINEFDFNALKKYVTSSKDETLLSLARKQRKKYSGSTSSMTAMLSHFHYLLSAWRPINLSTMSKSFKVEHSKFTQIMRAPAATFLHLRDGVYAIDADKEYDFATILSMLGKSMEKLLTLPRDEFERYRKKNSDQITEEERNAEEAFHYTTMGDFLMRSQLDAYDPRLPGTGMFDLKTRSVVSIRMDASGYQKGLGYELRKRYGNWESYEREYFDMIRSTMLKYSLQVRMGRMDGIFVAYHNTQRIFGFQYISINEMDHALHGTDDRAIGDMEFKLSLHLLNKVMDQATNRFPGRSIRLHVETRDTNPPLMYIFAKPVTPREIEDIQSSQKETIAKYESQILGLVHEQQGASVSEAEDIETGAEQVVEKEAATVYAADVAPRLFWEEMQEKVEAAIEDDSLGVDHVREAIRDALEQSGLLKARTSEEARGYVDSLLEALTRSEGTEDVDASATTNLETGSLTLEVDQAGALTVTDKTGQPTDGENLTDIANANVEASEAELLKEEASRSSAVETQNVAESRVYGDSSLKELILQMASTIEEKPEFDEAEIEGSDEDADSDTSKLRTFGKILSELVAKSKEAESDTAMSAASETSEVPSSAAGASEDLEHGAQSKEQQTTEIEDPEEVPQDQAEEILGMHLTVRNKVNGVDVIRPNADWKTLDWELEYSLNELPPDQAQRIYRALKTRRCKVFKTEDEERSQEWYKMWKGKLHQTSQSGRNYRKKEDKASKTRPLFVVGKEEPMTWNDAFGYLKEWKEPSDQQPDDRAEETGSDKEIP